MFGRDTAINILRVLGEEGEEALAFLGGDDTRAHDGGLNRFLHDSYKAHGITSVAP